MYTCNNSVLLPTPGSPPTKTKEPSKFQKNKKNKKKKKKKKALNFYFTWSKNLNVRTKIIQKT
jgi:hypothetical protein